MYQVNLFRHRESQHSRQIEAIGGGGVTAPIRIDGEGDKLLKRAINVGYGQPIIQRKFFTLKDILTKPHNLHYRHPVTAITISLTSSTLLVGTASGTIQLYDIASHQLLRTINNASLKGHAITHLQTLLRPPDLIGHVSANLGSGGGVVSVKEVEPTRPIVPFQRIRDVKAREAHEVLIALPGASQVETVSVKSLHSSFRFRKQALAATFHGDHNKNVHIVVYRAINATTFSMILMSHVFLTFC